MPPRRSNKKKKNQRSAAAIACAQCSAAVSKRTSVKCVCTRVVFCSQGCKESALSPEGSHACPGPPEEVVDLHQNNFGQQSPAWLEENRRTVNEPMRRFMMEDARLNGRTSLDDLSVDGYARFADQGCTAFAYLAGVRYKNRMLGDIQMSQGRGESMAFDNSSQAQQLGILETNDLAFKYLSQAAEAGHGLAMQSLGDCYEGGIGVQESIRMCREWYWRATLQKSAGAFAILETKCVLRNEVVANCHMLEQIKTHITPGQTCAPVGPNIASILLAFHRELDVQNYSLPPFAACIPTLRVGTRPSQGTTGPVELIGTEYLKELSATIADLTSQHNSIDAKYGRRGIGKVATAQTYGAATRSLDSPLFVVPPAPGCDERPTDFEISTWVAAANKCNSYGKPLGLEVCCVHSESGSVVCMQCVTDARERLEAVSCGGAVLSLQEVLPSRGHTAIFRKPDGTVTSERFKDYGRGEVETALAVLVAAWITSGYSEALVYPLFVAQDPNLFWLLVLNHGCIRAALEFVAPHVDWAVTLGELKPPPDQIHVISDRRVRPGALLRKCGSDICLKIEHEGHKGGFSACGRCQRRYYCSQQCQRTDWTFHKRECKAAATGSKAAAHPAAPTGHDMQSSKGDSPPFVGEKVVLYGLAAKPELNGVVGEIAGALTSSGRYPLKLPGGTSKIAIKPSNFHRLGVFVKDRRQSNKSQKFECFDHGAEVCSECSMDFTIANNLSKVNLASESALSRDTIEQVTEAHFATIQDAAEDGSRVHVTLMGGFPMECQGLKSDEKRVVLKALVESKDKSVHVAAAVVGMSCFGGRAEPATRPFVLLHLEALLSL